MALTPQQQARLQQAISQTRQVRAGNMANNATGGLMAGGSNLGQMGEGWRARVNSGQYTGTYQDWLNDARADATPGNDPRFRNFNAPPQMQPQTQGGLLGPPQTTEPFTPQPGGLLGPGDQGGLGGMGPMPGGLPGPSQGGPATPQPGWPIGPGGVGDPNMGPFPPGSQGGGGMQAPGGPAQGGGPGGHGPMPMPGQNGMPTPNWAAYGMMRGPNGELMPAMLRQGMNPYQTPPGGPMGYGPAPSQGGLLGGGGLPLSAPRGGLLGG